jgi:hypothetical protein
MMLSHNNLILLPTISSFIKATTTSLDVCFWRFHGCKSMDMDIIDFVSITMKITRVDGGFSYVSIMANHAIPDA